MMRFAAIPLALLIAATATRAAPVTPAASDGPLSTAQRHFEAGNYNLAITELRSSLAQNPKDAAAYHLLGRCYYEERDYDSAITQGEQAIQLDPPNSEYHQWLGRSYGGKADRERSFFLARKTRQQFEEAVRLKPSNLSARRDLEEFYLGAPWILGGSRDRAREQVDAIAAADPIEGHLARAIFWREGKKPDLAAEEYRLVLEKKPNRIEPYFEAAGFYQQQGDAAKMEAAIEAAVRVNATDARLAYYRGVERVLAGNHLPEAEQYLKSYLASTPERSDWPSHAAARESLGQLYERTGKRMEAAEQYRAALQLDPARKEARARLQQLEKSPR